MVLAIVLRVRRRTDHGGLAVRPAGAADRARGRRRARTGAGRSRSSPGSRSRFLVSILFAAWMLDALGLPKDLLRNISIGLLFLLAATLIFPQVGVWIERPLAAALAPARPATSAAASCSAARSGSSSSRAAGRRSAFVTSSAAPRDFGFKTIAVAIAYTLGVCDRAARDRDRRPARRAARCARRRAAPRRLRRRPRRSARSRSSSTSTRRLQTWLPNYTQRPPGPDGGERVGQEGVRADDERHRADAVAHGRDGRAALPDYGPAPDFAGIDELAEQHAADDRRSSAARSSSSTSGRTRASTACARSRTSRRGTGCTGRTGS